MKRSVVIELNIEAAALNVIVRARNCAEPERLLDRICSHDQLSELVARALEIGEEQQAA